MTCGRPSRGFAVWHQASHIWSLCFKLMIPVTLGSQTGSCGCAFRRALWVAAHLYLESARFVRSVCRYSASFPADTSSSPSVRRRSDWSKRLGLDHKGTTQ